MGSISCGSMHACEAAHGCGGACVWHQQHMRSMLHAWDAVRVHALAVHMHEGNGATADEPCADFWLCTIARIPCCSLRRCVCVKHKAAHNEWHALLPRLHVARWCANVTLLVHGSPE